MTGLQKKLAALKTEYDTKSKAVSASWAVTPDVTGTPSEAEATAPSNESNSDASSAQVAMEKTCDRDIETTTDVLDQVPPAAAAGEHDEPMLPADAGPPRPSDPHSKLNCS